MKFLISGHRLYKLEQYDCDWIKLALSDVVSDLVMSGKISYGYSGMASGIDLWFCRELLNHNVPYAACIPFEDQADTMDEVEKADRNFLLERSATKLKVKNSYMVEKAEWGIVVFDGNKGGTHNVFQQLIENQKPFVWINPVGKKIWRCE
jgi:uncharacterized phage-like protein YoqJ